MTDRSDKQEARLLLW